MIKAESSKSTRSTKSARAKKPANPYYYGTHAVAALLLNRPEDALALFVQMGERSGAIDAIVQTAAQFGVSVQTVAKDNLSDLCQSSQHQGIAVQARARKLNDEADVLQLATKADALLVILDQITDAHNLGACLRSSLAMGADAVILPKTGAATITPAVAKVSVGASEKIAVVATNLAQMMEKLKAAGVFIYGAALDDGAQLPESYDLTGKIALVMGSEGEGMRRLTQEKCDGLLYIPMQGVQSLNISVALGMVLGEVARQRRMV